MIKKTTLSLALVSVLSTGTSQAYVIDMSFDGLFTMLDPRGAVVENFSYPYYGDATWGYGKRTQISGTMVFETDTGAGTATINPFEFYIGGNWVTSNFKLQSIGSGLVLGNMTSSWNGSDITSQIVLDASGLTSALWSVPPPLGAVLDQALCTTGLSCATPASNDTLGYQYAIGPVPIATSTYNVNGATGLGTTLEQLSLGTDDGIGGSPMDNGPFSYLDSGFNINLDITSLYFTDIVTVPVPAAVWLFGSGLIGLVGFAKRKKA